MSSDVNPDYNPPGVDPAVPAATGSEEVPPLPRSGPPAEPTGEFDPSITINTDNVEQLTDDEVDRLKAIAGVQEVKLSPEAERLLGEGAINIPADFLPEGLDLQPNPAALAAAEKQKQDDEFRLAELQKEHDNKLHICMAREQEFNGEGFAIDPATIVRMRLEHFITYMIGEEGSKAKLEFDTYYYEKLIEFFDEQLPEARKAKLRGSLQGMPGQFPVN